MIKATKHHSIPFIALVLLCMPLSMMTNPVLAEANTDRVLLRLAKGGVSLEQAVAQVKKQTGGKVLTAETVMHEGEKAHRIKVLLPNGRVRVIFVNAN